MSDLHIPTPCHESWDAMTPTSTGRHCAACNHTVLDVTELPVAEGRQVLAEVATTLRHSGKRICVRAHATPSGRLLPGRRKLLTPALVTLLACTMAGCVGDGPDLATPQPSTTQSATPQTPQSVSPQATPTQPRPTALTGTPAVRPAPVAQVPAVVGDVCLSPKHTTATPAVEPAPAIKGKIVAPAAQ